MLSMYQAIILQQLFYTVGKFLLNIFISLTTSPIINYQSLIWDTTHVLNLAVANVKDSKTESGTYFQQYLHQEIQHVQWKSSPNCQRNR